MNDMSLIALENAKLKKLEDYNLDEKSTSEFKSKIKKVDEEIGEVLGAALLEFIASKDESSDVTDDFIAMIIKLIISGADLEYKDKENGDFPLLVCIRKGFLEIAYLLLRAGVNVNQTNAFLTTPVMAASKYGYKELLELLILLGANVNANSLDGNNALMYAKQHNQQECFDVLVHAQSYLTHMNMANKSIFDLPGDVSLDPGNIIKPILRKDKNDIFLTSGRGPEILIDEAKKQLVKFKNDIEVSI